MARFYPPSLQHTPSTGGQDRFFAFLQDALPPGEDHGVWFKPSVPGARVVRPHFVLAGPDTGFRVFRVEDWREGDVRQSAGGRLRVRTGKDKVLWHPHPLAAASEWAVAVGRRLRAVLDPDGEKALGLRVLPAAVFPFLPEEEVLAWKAEGSDFPPGSVLTAGDLEDPSGFLNKVEGAAPPAYPLDGSRAGREAIRAVLEPQLHFWDLRETPEPEPAGHSVAVSKKEPEAAVEPAVSASPVDPQPAANAAARVDPKPAAPVSVPGFWLDRKQERMARELASPRTLVYGPAGCGKTVFLMSRAQYWLDRHPGSRVLFTCYNASLASHLRQVFANRGMGDAEGRLVVLHYHEMCGNLLGIADIHNRPPEFYAALEPRVLQELSRNDEVPAYDLILVDEGQDFTRRMFEVLVRLNASGGEITLVCDPAQDIYRRWSAENLTPFGGHETEYLVDCYRNTAPIFALALSVLPGELREKIGLSRLEMTRPEDLGREGPAPVMEGLGDLDQLVEILVEQVRLFQEAGRPLSELAVLYPDRRAVPDFLSRLRKSSWAAAADPRFSGAGEDDEPHETRIPVGTLHPQSDRDDAPPSEKPHFAEALERELQARDVPAEWVARDFASKSAYDISKPRVTLSTIHSAKGMDFHTVILLGADRIPADAGETFSRGRSLLFTGITRARERLLIPYFEETGWVPGLRERLSGIAADQGGFTR